MNKECYSFEEQTLIISDPELDLLLQETFSPALLPEEFHHQENLDPVVPKGFEFHMTVDHQKRLKEAFLKKNDKRNGECCLYYPSGTLQARSYYVDGALHGPSIFYSEEGKELANSWFWHGQQQGKCQQFYHTGALYSIQRYKNNQFDGKQEFFFEDGKPKTFMNYVKGDLEGTVTLYHRNGQAAREMTFSGGKRLGRERQWESDGTLVVECEYDGPTLVGTSRRWHSDGGQLAEEVEYLEPGKCNVKQWSSDGVLLREGFFDEKNNYFHKIYNTDGELQQEQRGYWDGRRLCSGERKENS